MIGVLGGGASPLYCFSILCFGCVVLQAPPPCLVPLGRLFHPAAPILPSTHSRVKHAAFDAIAFIRQSSVSRCDLPSLRSYCTVPLSSPCCSSPLWPHPHSPFLMAARAKTGSIAVLLSFLPFSMLLPCRRVTPPISSSTCPATLCTVRALLTTRANHPHNPRLFETLNP